MAHVCLGHTFSVCVPSKSPKRRGDTGQEGEDAAGAFSAIHNQKASEVTLGRPLVGTFKHKLSGAKRVTWSPQEWVRAPSSTGIFQRRLEYLEPLLAVPLHDKTGSHLTDRRLCHYGLVLPLVSEGTSIFLVLYMEVVRYKGKQTLMSLTFLLAESNHATLGYFLQ